MSQTDLNVANASGATVRADLNAHLDALVSLSSGATEPATKFPNQWWYDTSTSQLKVRNNANTAWLSTPQIDTVLDTNGNAINESEGTPVASAVTTDIWVTDGNTVHVTGTTTITSFGTAPRIGAWRKVIFDAALILTDGANLNIIGNANITTAVDDWAWIYAETTTLFKVLYFKADGSAVVSSTVAQATRSAIEVEANEDTYTPPDLIRHSPGVAKVWGIATYSGGIPTLQADHGVSSITDVATGQIRWNFDNSFSTTNYSVLFSFEATSVGSTQLHTFQSTAQRLTGSVEQTSNNNASLTDPIAVTIAAYGDQ